VGNKLSWTMVDHFISLEIWQHHFSRKGIRT
jgi:hypothetical protein